MALILVLFFGSGILIYFSCEYFVNGVEWLGKRLAVSQTATGTILAAFGTALPESVVTFVAVVFGNTDAEREIGIGAALGGPLALSTLRSEEHTSELQSQFHLVCRLLLEKKNELGR